MVTKAQLEKYLRASDEDVLSPDWEDVLAACENVVAQAYLDMNLWDLGEEGQIKPTLHDVTYDAMATDYLVFAHDSEKAAMLTHILQTNPDIK